LRAGIRQRIKVKKTDALYLIYKHGGNPYIKEASNNTYNVRVDNDSGQIFENEKTLLFKLKKNKEQEYFEILREWKEGTDIPFTKQEDRVSELDDGFIPLEGIILTRVMELIAKMQRSYNKNNDKIEYIYIDHGAIDKENKSIIQFGDNILEKSKQEDKSSFFNLDIEDPDGINEFLFMPYIGEDGYIDKNNPQLRDDYIASVFKSMVQKHKEIKTHTNYKSIKQFDDGIETVKYELEEYNEKHWHDFVDPIEDVFGQQVDIEQKFVEVIKRVKCSELRKHVGHDSNYGQYKRIVYFNYYKTILQKIKEDPQILENYYEIEAASNYDQEEVLRHPRAKEATHVIKLQPNHKTKLEYKYNPEDEIIGGDLKLYVKEEETQNTLREKPAKKFKIKKDSSKSKESMLDQREKKISASQKIEASPEFKKNKKLITNLNKKSSAKQIKKAVEVVISEAKRKRKPVIAESLEDYLSGMYTTKKVHDKKLRALDMIKTAEVELKLKMDRDLIWKLNDILYCTNKFKPYQEITFNLKKSRLVNPIGRTLEGLLNSSKKSILKAEANFVLEKVLNRKKLRLKGQLSYRWENNYRWIAGRNKHLPGYGKIDDYLFKKLADKKFARPYKMYSEWDYYLTDKISLLKDEVDSLRDWLWDDFCMFEHV
jgi:hypothetical protein